MIDLITTIGVAGATLILFAFILNQLNKWKEDSISYDVVNFIGASLLVIYAWLLGSYPFLILNIVWAGISFKDIFFKNN